MIGRYLVGSELIVRRQTDKNNSTHVMIIEKSPEAAIALAMADQILLVEKQQGGHQ